MRCCETCKNIPCLTRTNNPCPIEEIDDQDIVDNTLDQLIKRIEARKQVTDDKTTGLKLALAIIRQFKDEYDESHS